VFIIFLPHSAFVIPAQAGIQNVYVIRKKPKALQYVQMQGAQETEPRGQMNFFYLRFTLHEIRAPAYALYSVS